MKGLSLRKKGFTLIELIVSIAVIGILIMLAFPKLLDYVDKAKMTQIKNDVKAAEDLLSEYSIKNNNFPDEWDDVSIDKLQSIASKSVLYDVRGHVKTIKNGEYKEIDKGYLIKGIKTRLGGKFYINENHKVYYEDNKPSKIKEKDNLFDREIEGENFEQNEIEILDYVFPNGIYKNGETAIGNIKIKGVSSGNYHAKINFKHSKLNNSIEKDVTFNLTEDEIKIIDFDLLVEPSYLRGFHDFKITIEDSGGNALAKYRVNQSLYFAETEWVYYYEDDFNKIDRPVAGQIGSLSSDRVNFEYVLDESGGTVVDYSSIIFDVQSDSNQSGQINTILPETYGTYEAMIKVPDNDALLNGFFLYGYNGKEEGVEHEIDIEILYYEGKWQAWGTIFNETNENYVYNGIEPGLIYQKKVDLDFDPSEDYHSYRIDFYKDYVSFAVDGNEFGRWENKFDYGDMHLYAGNFYTHWLTGELSDEKLEMNVKWARKGYFK